MHERNQFVIKYEITLKTNLNNVECKPFRGYAVVEWLQTILSDYVLPLLLKPTFHLSLIHTGDYVCNHIWHVFCY